MIFTRAMTASFRRTATTMATVGTLAASAVASAVVSAVAIAVVSAVAIADDKLPAAGSTAAKTAASRAAADERVAADVAKVNEQYIVAPKAAADLGCRVKWQTTVTLPTNGSLRMVSTSPTAVLALDNRNELTLVRSETGERAWTTSAASPVDRVIGLGTYQYATRAQTDDIRIAVMTDALFYGLGFDSGATLARSRFRHVPSTSAEQYGNMFIYGTNSGQVSWFNCATGTDTRGHVIDALRGGSPMIAAPAIGSGVVIAGSMRGGVIALGAATGELLWKKDLLAGVSAAPAVGDGVAFFASDDQYLYAFDLATGSTLWKYFTQTPLRTSPFVAGELVVQDVPGEGLLAFTQRPEGQPGGEMRWKRESVNGTPVGMIAGGLLFWSDKDHVATLISMKDGQTMRTVSMPSVDHLDIDAIELGGFVAWSSDGRIERLSPMTVATTTAKQ